jgi:quercetin dioxygenase-like cupin family protein
MKSKWMLALLFCLAAAAVFGTTVLATPQVGFSTVQLAKGLYDDYGVSIALDRARERGKHADIYVVRNTIAPGGHSGWHTHPGPSFVTVTSGQVTAYEADDPTCTGKVYKAGEGLIDQVRSNQVHLIRNETSEPAETITVQILPRDAQRRIDTPNPGNCRF